MLRIRSFVLVALFLIGGYLLAWSLKPGGFFFPAPLSYVKELHARAYQQGWKGTMSFLDGEYGMVLQGGTLYNRDSHIDFDSYHPGGFQVGIQGGQTGMIVDLGSLEELLPGRPAEVLFEEARYTSERLLIGEEAIWSPPEGSDRTSIEVGHCYFALIHEREGHPDRDIPALILVLEHEPGKRVKIRWSPL